MDRPCYRFERPADFLPLFADRPPYGPPGGGVPLLQRRLRPARADRRGGRRTVLRGRRTAAGVRAGRDDSERVLPAATSRCRTCAVGYLRVRTVLVYSIPVIGGADGGAQCTAADLDRFLRAVRRRVAARRPPGRHAHPARRRRAPGSTTATACFLYGDGRFGHGGGDPGVTHAGAAHPVRRRHRGRAAQHRGPGRRGPRPARRRGPARLAKRVEPTDPPLGRWDQAGRGQRRPLRPVQPGGDDDGTRSPRGPWPSPASPPAARRRPAATAAGPRPRSRPPGRPAPARTPAAPAAACRTRTRTTARRPARCHPRPARAGTPAARRPRPAPAARTAAGSPRTPPAAPRRARGSDPGRRVPRV